MATLTDERLMELYARWAHAYGMSPRTVEHRVRLIRTLERHLAGSPLLEATADQLAGFQDTYAGLKPASRNVYSRHVRAVYRWAADNGHIDVDPAARLPVTRLHRGQPHPTTAEDLNVILLCTTGALRLAYALAAFAGLRCGEICRADLSDITREFGRPVTAIIHGKGGRERVVPIVPPLLDEIDRHVAHRRRGTLLLHPDGTPWRPQQLSLTSSKHLANIGMATTLHSMRHAYATRIYAATRDPLLVRDLLGHSSVTTTEIYMQSSTFEAESRIGAITEQATALLTG